MDYEDRSGGMEFDVTYVVEHAGRAELRNTLLAEYRRHVGKPLDDVLLRSIIDRTMGVFRELEARGLLRWTVGEDGVARLGLEGGDDG